MISIREVNGNRVMERDGQFVCCDTPVMRAYFERQVGEFHGRVLTTGLGLGVALSFLCALPAVESVDCVEQDLEVLCAYGELPEKASLILADAWELQGEYDCCFHDIWSDYEGKEAEASRLEARFGAPLQVSLPKTFGR